MKFWYRDNWSGKERVFKTLREAKFSALKETGVSVVIHRKDGSIACIAKASGHSPA